MAQTTIRANLVPEGGAVQPNGRGMGGQSSKLDIVKSVALTEAFMEASEYNEVSQGAIPLMQGQSTTLQIRNVGFLQKTWLNFDFEFDITKLGGEGLDLSFGNDFPYSLINRVTTQLNGATVLHSGTAAELQAVYDKKYSGEYDYKANITNPLTPLTDNNGITFANFDAGGIDTRLSGWLEMFGVNTQKHDITLGVVDGGGATASDVPDNYAAVGCILSRHAGNVFSIVRVTKDNGNNFATDDKVRLHVSFSLPLEYTISRDNLVGLLPLQNNSIYLEVRIDMANKLFDANEFGAAPILTIGEAKLLSASVNPVNCFWSVPMPNDARLYNYFISFNYLNQSQSIATTGAGPNGFNFNLKNNAYLMSTLFTFRDSETRMLIPSLRAMSNMYMDYNGTAQVLNIPMFNEFRDLRYRFNGKLPLKMGEYLKDFANATRDTNGHIWAKFVDLYQANSPRFVGDTIQPNMTVNCMMEYIAPVLTQQII